MVLVCSKLPVPLKRLIVMLAKLVSVAVTFTCMLFLVDRVVPEVSVGDTNCAAGTIVSTAKKKVPLLRIVSAVLLAKTVKL